MDQEERRRRDEELDRFWDIDALIPRKRAAHYVADTETTEIELTEIPSKTAETMQKPVPRSIPIPKEDDRPKPRFIPPHTEEEQNRKPAPDEEYTPENALIRSVRLYRWKSNYRYYEGFVRDAVRLLEVRGQECARVPFFSYVPQYGQMSRAQLEWYLWWRENFQNSVFLDTDYSYVLLYAYERINLSGKTDARRTQESLCTLWVQYRQTYRQLDSYLPEWICDYSLIHRLPPPTALSGSLLSEVMAHCHLKEFYVPSGGEDGYLRALLAFSSNYDYHKSKFCTDERVELFDKAVREALRAVTRHLSRDGQLFSASGMDDSKMVRDAYTGALCSYRIKRRIEVEFCSFSRSHELRYFVTDVVKYTENKLRAALGIRSRLSVYALPTSVRDLLDATLAGILPVREHSERKKDEASEVYEKLYDLPQKKLSLSAAAEIERLSWETTERLVEAFEEASNDSEPKSPIPSPAPMPTAVFEPTDTECGDDALKVAMQPYLAFLQAVWAEDAIGQKNAARDANLPLEVLADEVNGVTAEHMGDILLEEIDGSYHVIEDYREILKSVIEL